MPAFGQAVELCRIVGQQHHAGAAEHLQHAHRHAIVALVVVETERGVGVDRIEAGVLQLVGPHLVGEAEAAAFLREIEDDAAAGLLSRASASWSWSPQSQRREPNTSPVRHAEWMRTGTGFDRSGVPTITATGSSPNASRNTTKRVRTPEFSGTWASPAMVSDCVASARKRATAPASMLTIDGLMQARDLRRRVGDQHRGQHLRELDQLDRGHCRGAGRLRQERMIRFGFGGHRENLGRVDVGREFQRDRLVGVDAERARAQPGQHQARHDRRAQRPERREAILVQSLDRQAEQRFTAAGDHNRAACPKFRQPPADPNLRPGSKEN